VVGSEPMSRASRFSTATHHCCAFHCGKGPAHHAASMSRVAAIRTPVGEDRGGADRGGADRAHTAGGGHDGTRMNHVAVGTFV
jgi:hypothetical protein